MRHRVEDLGRIAAVLDQILDADVWCLYSGRKKDFLDYFSELDEEKKDDLLHALIYGIDSLRESLNQIRDIAYGEDPLNEHA